ncbi:hypothetical protein [Streptomyces sp. NBC_00038]|uniref:hypothetical protein n=1 Tax=Streptomyces sp. NBC_00038 TaxID=2903615 RepID=UPI00224C8EE2|nr:hypothetical protein [Streptomyces sp. NBC_00038]MCX5562763.1 hypothetical protein [Streptomyces sp. NBC_00038]MCX5563587.1 hypothetical protein [Streptomyces sp. NBC_00038]
MTNYISECGYCRETQFTGWYSKSAPHDMYGRVDRDYCDGRPVAYCSEEHRDAADALRESSAAAAAALAELLTAPPAWLPPVDHWEIAEDDGAWLLSASLRGADDLGESRRYHLIERIAAASKLPVEDDGRIVKARFVVDGVQAQVWYLRPIERWIVPEQCATCPTELGAPDVKFVRLGEGRDAPVVCVACRDRMYAAWIRAARNETLVKAREAAAGMFEVEAGERRPMWRVIITDSESPTGVALVCTAEGDDDLHLWANFGNGIERVVDGVWDCCPDTQFDTYSTVLAEYLVELLNADTEAGEQQ